MQAHEPIAAIPVYRYRDHFAPAEASGPARAYSECRALFPGFQDFESANRAPVAFLPTREGKEDRRRQEDVAPLTPDTAQLACAQYGSCQKSFRVRIGGSVTANDAVGKPASGPNPGLPARAGWIRYLIFQRLRFRTIRVRQSIAHTRGAPAFQLGDLLATSVTGRIGGGHRGVADFAAYTASQRWRWRTRLRMGEVVLADRLATNTTGRHVKQGTAEFQSQGFAHGLSEGQDAAGATNMDVTP